MLRRAALLALALALPAPDGVLAAARRPRAARGVAGEVVLDGERVPVRWIDGDSFHVDGGRLAGGTARLAGVNALETFGPVHRIGALGGEALLAIARASAPLAAGRVWTCASRGRRDRYGRRLVECPDAAAALVAAGHAMVFAMDGSADAALLAAQRRAQREGAGMWAGGVPPRVPASLHAEGEPGLGRRGAYDRVVDTRTGAAEARPHRRRYAVCEEVCLGDGAERACLTYVPFALRYRRTPSCLR